MSHDLGLGWMHDSGVPIDLTIRRGIFALEPSGKPSILNVLGTPMRRIMEVLADQENRLILTSLGRSPKTVAAIESELKISQSGAYRRIEALREAGLVMVESYRGGHEGRKEAVYCTTFKEIIYKLVGDEVHVEIVENDASVEQRWFELFFSSDFQPA